MKKLLLFLAVSIGATALCATTAFAQEKEKVVTGTISILAPSNVTILDEFISNQLYTGSSVFTGLDVRLGALYRKHDNLSWDVHYTGYNRPKLFEEGRILETLSNPANTQYIKYSTYSIAYGTYYHWNIGKKLMIKTGGICDLYGAMKNATPDGVNNSTSLEGQLILKAHAAIKYGWDFKKWGLDLRGRISLPVVGLITSDHPSEKASSLIGANDHSITNPAFRHIFMAFYHNYMSLDYEIGIDFVLKPCTINLGLGNTSKWWSANDIQCIRKISYVSMGLSFDIVGRNKFKSSNRNF